MSDIDDVDLDGGEPADSGGSEKKKASGIGGLLPNLLKFVAIGIGALIFIVTVSVITVNIIGGQGTSQTVIPDNTAYQGQRPVYSMYTSIGTIRTNTRDVVPYAVVVDMVIGYDQNDNAAANEMTERLYELRDFVRNFFRSKMAVDLSAGNETRLKQEIIELLNTRILNTAKARIILFNQLDVMEM